MGKFNKSSTSRTHEIRTFQDICDETSLFSELLIFLDCGSIKMKKVKFSDIYEMNEGLQLVIGC